LRAGFSQALFRSLAHYSHAFDKRLFQLYELSLLEAAGRSLGKGFYKTILKQPGQSEDWINLARFLHPSETVALIDVGANVGTFTKDFLRYYPMGRSICFEPVAGTFQILTRNFSGDSRVTLHHNALSDTRGVASINVFENSTLCSLTSYNPEANEHYNTALPAVEETTCITLDDVEIEADYDNLLVKIDVQGFEQEVIRGGKNLLAKAAVVLLECSFVDEYCDKEPSFAVCSELLRQCDLYPVIFQGSGRQLSNYPFERDVLFVNRELAKNIWFKNYGCEVDA
jgi:FkbM family methyltransferase